MELGIEAAQKALEVGCESLGLQTDVKVEQIKHGSVWVLSFDQDPTKPNFAYAMIRLERWLKAYLAIPSIELQCESLDDKNRRDIKHGRKVAPMVNARNVEKLES